MKNPAFLIVLENLENPTQDVTDPELFNKMSRINQWLLAVTGRQRY